MPPFQTHPLETFFAPRSVAVVGAIGEDGGLGKTVLGNLISSPFGGSVCSVNPMRSTLHGIAAYPSLIDVPEHIDLAIVVAPADDVPAIISQGVVAGITAAIVMSEGFGEGGTAGVALARRMLDEAGRGPMRVIGPNCLGVMNPHTGLNATCATSMARPGSVGFVSQSGALGTAVLDWSHRAAVGFSAFGSIGSMLDVDWGDVIGYLGSDAHTRSIVLAMESIGDARSFLSAAREVALTKPIIVIKAGRMRAADRADGGLTDPMADGDAVLDAAFRRCGVLRVQTIADLFYMADVLAKQPRPRGPRLTILTNAGGPGVLAGAALVRHGGELTPLSDAATQAFHRLLPSHRRPLNPVDMLGDASPTCYAQALDIALRDPNSDGVLVILTPQAMADPTGTAAALTAHVRDTSKPVLASWMGGAHVAAGHETLDRAGIPSFPYPDTAARIFTYMWSYSDALRGLYETPVLPDDIAGVPDRMAAERILHQARAAGRTLLADRESKQLLAAYGIPAMPTGAAPGVDDGYQLVLRCSPNPEFGPVLLFGSGGPLADVYGDYSLALPPLTTTLARRMMERTRIFSALMGVRGRRPVDLAALEALMVRFSQLIVEQRLIDEIHIDPLIVSPERIAVLDAHAVLHAPEVDIRQIPPLAIRPYPRRYVRQATLKTGEAITIRPIRPEDEPLMVPFHEGLSDRSVYLRYFHMMKLNQRVAHERLTRICFIDYDREMALVAERRGGDEGRALIGVARLHKVHGTRDAEFSVLVGDRYQSQGLGSELMHRLIEVAREEGLARIHADVLSENVDMLRLCTRLGINLHHTNDAQLVRAELEL